VLAEDDTLDAHVQDTLTAGAGLCDETVTRYVVEHGKAAIDWLIDQGVPFTKDSSSSMGYHLHPRRRAQPPAHHPCGGRNRPCGTGNARRTRAETPEHHGAGKSPVG